MSRIEHTAIREPGTQSAAEFARRVQRLAAFYVLLFLGSLVGIAILIWQAQLYVTLAQRSNVETLTIAFLFVFFAYLAALSAPGALGAARLVYYSLPGWFGGDPVAVARRKTEALGPPSDEPPACALNLALEREGAPGQPFRLAVADEAGSMGWLAVDGAEVQHADARKDGSNGLLAYFVRQVEEVLGDRGRASRLDIVEWRLIDDENTDQYLGLVRFARNLERHLGAAELWPKLTLTDAHCAELERRLSAVCPALRDEAFLPHWEYAGEHKLPLIPEPLGLISLSRSERRVDPEASMGCAVMVVLGALVVLVLLVKFPPWVPGS
jgi:hypothetical protein